MQTTKQKKAFAKMTKGFRKKEKDDGGWLGNLRKKKDDVLMSCPHHRLSTKGNDRCLKGGFSNTCTGLNLCDYFQNLKNR